MMSEQQSDRRLLEELATEALRERRARRRWGIFFRALFFAYLIFVTVLAVRHKDPTAESSLPRGEHSAVVRIEGVIAAGRRGVGANAESVNRSLRRAFESKNAKGVILRVNSPGGSAVESNRIFKEIMRLKKESGKKVVAVAGDNCASGGYFIAAAADEIYVDEASIVGSIGVIYGGFGFAEAMEKLGVERRVVTAGSDKNMLDPFSPARPEDAERIGEILGDVHRVFIDAVKLGRGERLSGAGDEDIFSGGIYGGAESVRLGLADGLGDAHYVAREIIGAEKMLLYEEPRFWGEEWLDRFSLSFAGALAGILRAPLLGGSP